ncbi:hypothetical protein D4764_07G0008670 [Takifugu flavidus]|uniref:Uncharacterized protein n=1 Tax=Takifugu flavidus TaxID=433684 RepID=A0A5C6MUX6_9TELE|nr:hypothetical protein D4764_07G0008670 [Takifugu flavidus]
MFSLSFRELSESTKSCSKQHKRLWLRTKEAPPIAHFTLAGCKQIQGCQRMCVFTHTGGDFCCTVACPLISQGFERGCSQTVTAGAARRKPLSHHTDPGARRRWSKINVLAIPEMPLFKSQRRGEEKG